MLGARYSQGQGVPQDNKEAIKWYKKAAEQEVVFAQWTLGRQYFKGEGLARNYKEAVKWTKKTHGEGKRGVV